jgi:hypothetical protein
MHRALLLTASIFVLSFGVRVSDAQTSQSLIGVYMEEGCAFAVAAGGDVYLSHYVQFGSDYTQTPWVPAGNVFASAGTGGGSPLVGITNNGWAICRDGSYFFVQISAAGCNGMGATYFGNIFSDAHSSVPGQEITGTGWNSGPNGFHNYAACNTGAIFRKNVAGTAPPQWEYAGNAYGDATSSRSGTWGSLHVRYR